MMDPLIAAANGGFAPKFCDLMGLDKIPKNQRPDFRDWVYWLPFIGMPIVGAALAYIYIQSNMPLSPILAFNVGVSAPLIIRSMAESQIFKKPIDPGIGA